MSKHQAYIPGSTEVEGHVHEQDTWSPADWDLAQIALVCLGGIIVLVVILLFVGGCQHADCRKVGEHRQPDSNTDKADKLVYSELNSQTKPLNTESAP